MLQGRRHVWSLFSCLFVLSGLIVNADIVRIDTDPGEEPVLLRALHNPSVTEIVLNVPHVTVNHLDWSAVASPNSPLQLKRDVIIRSEAVPPAVLDCEHIIGRVRLGQNVTVTLTNLVLVNAKRLIGYGLDLFVGSANARIILDSVIRVKAICQQPGQANIAAATTYPNLPGYPANSITLGPGICIANALGAGERQCFNETLQLNSLATEETQNDVEGSGFDQGYTLFQHNTTRVCQSYLDPQCLQQHYPEYCWAQAAAGLQNNQPTLLTAGAIAGIAIAGGMVLIALMLLWCCRSRILQSCVRKGGKQQQTKNQPPMDGGSLMHHHLHNPLGEPMPPGSVSSDVPNQVKLGVLLGTGSFGRVYAGKWHGHDVAVKIMSCRPSELKRVLLEAEIMMQLDHRNIVRALNCSVRQTGKTEGKLPQAHSTSGSNLSRLDTRLSKSDNRRSMSTAAATPSTPSNTSRLPAAAVAFTSITQPGRFSSEAAETSTSSGLLPAWLSNRLSIGSADALVGQYDRIALTKGQVTLVGAQSTSTTDGTEQQTGSSSKSQGSPCKQQGSGSRSVAVHGGSSGLRQQVQHSSTRVYDVEAPRSALEVQLQLDEDFGTTVEFKEREDSEVWLVLELCAGGNLKDSAPRANRDTQSMAVLLCRLHEVASGMVYLHSKGILHGDLKAANVLLQNTIYGSYGQIAKLTDFGLAAVLLEGATHRSTQRTGTITHTAPEVLASGHLSPAADVYSFGIMMWELYTNSACYHNLHYGAVVERVVLRNERPPLPADAPDEYNILMSMCWAAEPKNRPDFSQIAKCLDIILEGMNAPEGSAIEQVQEQLTSESNFQFGAAGLPATPAATVKAIKLPADEAGDDVGTGLQNVLGIQWHVMSSDLSSAGMMSSCTSGAAQTFAMPATAQQQVKPVRQQQTMTLSSAQGSALAGNTYNNLTTTFLFVQDL